MSLGGVQVEMTDVNGTVWQAPLMYVTPTQVNYLVPAGVPTGRADVRILANGGTVVSSGVIEVRPVAPVLFTANGNAQGVAAGLVQRTHADGTYYEQIATWDPQQRLFVARPVRMGSDTLNLVLYGTGFDTISDVGKVSATVTYKFQGFFTVSQLAALAVGPVSTYPGLDQIRFALPAALAGAGAVTVDMTINGQTVNEVTFSVQ
jgi:uncharacterized protein (TIGR03437 family)